MTSSGVTPPLRRQVRHSPALELGGPLGLGDLEGLPPRLHLRQLEVSRSPGSPLGVGVGRQALGSGSLEELAEDFADVEVVGVGHRELHGQRPRRDLGPHVRSRRDALLVELDGRAVRPIWPREQGVREGAADLGLPLVDVLVGALLARGDEDHALAGLPRRSEQGLDLVGFGEAAGDGLAVDTAVGEREARREARSPGRDALLHQGCHLHDLVRLRRSLVCRVAHDVQAQRASDPRRQ